MLNLCFSPPQTLVKTFEVCDLPVRASKFVARKNWVITGAVSFIQSCVPCVLQLPNKLEVKRKWFDFVCFRIFC